MTIEEALEIIDNTNFYTSFTNTEQDEAFDMAYRALTMFRDYKNDLKDLQLMKDHASIVVSCLLSNEISQLEEGGKNGD